MFSEEDIRIHYNNYNSLITRSLDHGVSNIKCEFDEEKIKIHFDVPGNELHEENIDKPSSEKLHDATLPESFVKTEPSDMFFKDVKIEYVDVNSETYKKNVDFKTPLDHDLTNIKCEFEEEKTKHYYGVSENQLHVNNSSIKLQISDVEFPDSFLKTESTKSNMFFEERVKIEVKNGIIENNEEFNILLENGLSNIKCEFEAEETKIEYGVLEACVTKYSTDNNQQSLLNRPNKIYTVEKAYKSDKSDKCYKTNLNKCETCGKCFTIKGKLKIHMKIHTRKKNFKCKTCGKCFNDRCNLSRHLRIHTGEKPYECETCSQCFSQKHHLNVHMRTHTGEKPYKCDTCGKCFNANGQLHEHMRIHTDDNKPYKCETCGKCLSVKHALNIHMRTHTGEKPYKCELCDKCFNDKSNLTKHMRIHTREKNHVANPSVESYN